MRISSQAREDVFLRIATDDLGKLHDQLFMHLPIILSSEIHHAWYIVFDDAVLVHNWLEFYFQMLLALS